MSRNKAGGLLLSCVYSLANLGCIRITWEAVKIQSVGPQLQSFRFSRCLGWGLRICSSRKFTDDADAVGLGTAL